eukprot:TRINITY_DN6411_c0_g1_i2.p1 TRINITY_DN6411_c0_g1~~TRINITY_DN6411_c0_g1_i2.p1  ORF type:complete len:1030 (+),score=191.74 TRINITY_DN6411_c0_g1_i2:114-3203(+)
MPPTLHAPSLGASGGDSNLGDNLVGRSLSHSSGQTLSNEGCLGEVGQPKTVRLDYVLFVGALVCLLVRDVSVMLDPPGGQDVYLPAALLAGFSYMTLAVLGVLPVVPGVLELVSNGWLSVLVQLLLWFLEALLALLSASFRADAERFPESLKAAGPLHCAASSFAMLHLLTCALFPSGAWTCSMGTAAFASLLIGIGLAFSADATCLLQALLFVAAEGILTILLHVRLRQVTVLQILKESGASPTDEDTDFVKDVIDYVHEESKRAAVEGQKTLESRLDALTSTMSEAVDDLGEWLTTCELNGKEAPLVESLKDLLEHIMDDVSHATPVGPSYNRIDSLQLKGETDAVQDYVKRTFQQPPMLAMAGSAAGFIVSKASSASVTQTKSGGVSTSLSFRKRASALASFGTSATDSPDNSTKAAVSKRGSLLKIYQNRDGQLSSKSRESNSREVSEPTDSTTASDRGRTKDMNTPPQTPKSARTCARSSESQRSASLTSVKGPSQQPSRDRDTCTSSSVAVDETDTEKVRRCRGISLDGVDTTASMSEDEMFGKGTALADVAQTLAASLVPQRQLLEKEDKPWQLVGNNLETVASQLGSWGVNVVKLNKLVNEKCLAAVGNLAVAPYRDVLDIDSEKMSCFFTELQLRYNARNAYHNAMHGTDVMNNMVYFMRLQGTALQKLDPIEKLTGMVAAASHDVGHNSRSNRFHVGVGSALSMLYNDQSVLENMHCALTFMVLQIESCNFHVDLAVPLRASFRATLIRMILETDLAKHVAAVGRFRHEFLANRDTHAGENKLEPLQKQEILAFALKVADISHSSKPFHLHAEWTMRNASEFFDQGDAEKDLGIPVSPFCERYGTKLPESQSGFFQFIVSPLFSAFDEYLCNKNFSEDVMRENARNREFWKSYNGEGFSYQEPMTNHDVLAQAFAVYPGQGWEPPPANAAGTLTRRPSAVIKGGPLLPAIAVKQPGGAPSQGGRTRRPSACSQQGEATAFPRRPSKLAKEAVYRQNSGDESSTPQRQNRAVLSISEASQ